MEFFSFPVIRGSMMTLLTLLWKSTLLPTLALESLEWCRLVPPLLDTDSRIMRANIIVSHSLNIFVILWLA